MEPTWKCCNNGLLSSLLPYEEELIEENGLVEEVFAIDIKYELFFLSVAVSIDQNCWLTNMDAFPQDEKLVPPIVPDSMFDSVYVVPFHHKRPHSSYFTCVLHFGSDQNGDIQHFISLNLR